MARNERDKLPTWISPVVEYTFFICQMGSRTKLENAFDLYALQYFVTLKRDIFVECLGKQGFVCEIVNKTSTILLHCSDCHSPDRVYNILNELLKRTYDYVIDLRSPDGCRFSRQIRNQGPMQVVHGSAIVIKHDTKMICVSDNNDCIDSLLDEMGYHEVEYLDIKQFAPNLFSLGIEDASLHPNIMSIKVQHSQQECRIVWKGRAKETGDALIREFLKNCLQKSIDFVEGEQRLPYTDLACKVIFDESGDIKKHYAQYLKSLSKKKSKCTHFSLVQKDGRVVLYGRNGNVDNFKKEIEESISKHNLEMNLFEQTDVLNFLKKHKEKLWYDMLNGTLLCTRDLTSEVIKVCTSRPLRQRFEFNTEPVLLVAFLQENGEDLLNHAKILGVDILFDGTNIFLESSLDHVCKEFHIDLKKAVDSGRIVMSVNEQFTDLARIQTIMNQTSCSWVLHCNHPKAVISSQDFCKRWIDQYKSTLICLAEIGAAIACTDICIVFTADMLCQLGISSRRTDFLQSKTSKEDYKEIETFYGPLPVSNVFVGCREIHLISVKL
ncbi:uncharacterized protein LOC128211441 isoform X2 [Mya arenaria]|uniref:uncharacterized protein LOC128211441 isoform X2 n=1 Tax=Mya arenaria TaxID=6604 RepID=UPI0022E2F916|nr:uncharacterized protein LOC128211441 isoform X2 [Mya arenaria]